MNSYAKWLIGTLVGVILAGAGYNETRQWQQSDANAASVQQDEKDIVAAKEVVKAAKENTDRIDKTTQDTNEKLDKAIRKLDILLDQQKR